MTSKEKEIKKIVEEVLETKLFKENKNYKENKKYIPEYTKIFCSDKRIIEKINSGKPIKEDIERIMTWLTPRDVPLIEGIAYQDITYRMKQSNDKYYYQMKE